MNKVDLTYQILSFIIEIKESFLLFLIKKLYQVFMIRPYRFLITLILRKISF